MKKRALEIGLVLVFSLLLAGMRFGPLLEFSGTKVLDPWAEGYKAYSVIQYHIYHDSTYTHFEGMNYPYGEHAIPSATQPIISSILKLFTSAEATPSGFVFPLIHWSMYFGLALCLCFLYLIFRKLKVPVWYSFAAATGICFLSPQLLRIPVHFGLAHPEVLPMALFFLMRYEERPGWRRSLWISVLVFLYAGLHFYYVAILGALISLYFFFRWLKDRDWKRLPPYFRDYALQLLLPVLVYMIWLSMGADVSDRTELPWGFFEYRAHWQGLFTAVDLAHYEWISPEVQDYLRVGLEAKNYLGVAGVIGFFALFVRWIGRRFTPEIFQERQPLDPFLNRLLLISFLLLIFALGIPFIIPVLERGILYLGPLGQFRSIGRFTWILFYVVNIVAFYLLYRKAEAKQGAARIVWLALPLLLLWSEAYLFTAQKKLTRAMELHTIADWEPEHPLVDQLTFDPDSYQAILPIPYYNIGSDQFWMPVRSKVGQKSMTLSVQTGIPLTAAMLTRTSFQQTLNQIQLITPPYRSLQILEDLPDDRPLLLLWDTNAPSDILGPYEHLQARGRFLQETDDGFQLYELPLEVLYSGPQKAYQATQRRIDEQGWYPTPASPLQQSDSLATVYYNSFNESTAENTYAGAGCLAVPLQNRTLIYEETFPETTNHDWILSVWVYIGEDLLPRTSIHLKELDPGTGTEMWRIRTQVFDRVAVYDPSGWALVEIPFQSSSATPFLQLNARNQMYGQKPILWDELLIRPAGVNVHFKQEEDLWYNNRLYPKK